MLPFGREKVRLAGSPGSRQTSAPFSLSRRTGSPFVWGGERAGIAFNVPFGLLMAITRISDRLCMVYRRYVWKLVRIPAVTERSLRQVRIGIASLIRVNIYNYG